LSAKGKTELKPSGLEFTSGPSAISGRFTSPGEVSALFHFPRSVPYTLDDKEVEFATKLGDLSLKYKFRLKDMVFNRKLEL